ncbi:MotA/TolQ/ExbB proton channel family protein [Aquirufa regiilacus]|jgi:biopolymer transport protein ExbB|uniref:MotA/TolQ/ExbB proton channel family protein n=1 Tax=Aquirufa regiilacus TaxID=3024868 RepID=A0ABU3TQ31_9BACT|nr:MULTISPECIES: MotA/TolQ/ExbB proton channel family protein [unclassified Aquirufa]MBP6055688.1 MotA/TolQ/ExbB proton channel family protein [Cytophagaceae bacterium]MDT8887397.1 MotA/TolQ/ExbB proton channel family protein [Aquirufa sp. LEPPI-3A]MDU0807930.1 MotA/TolQ/ExbB proton channel family protein [Aquirufa sp. LEOWEIH-7C]
MSSHLNFILLDAAQVEEFTVLSLLEKGGYVMYPILFLFTAALFLFIERYLYIRKTSRIDENFLHNINELLLAGNIQGAVTYCKNSKFPIANLLERGLGRLGSPIRDIEDAIENKAKLEIYNMEKNLGILSSIARIAPMFGFLGTVTGMIRTFHNISTSNKIEISTIASGIYEKMVTSASGLIVGIIAYVMYTLLTTMIDRSINKMEIVAMDFIDLLHKPANKK